MRYICCGFCLAVALSGCAMNVKGQIGDYGFDVRVGKATPQTIEAPQPALQK